MAEKKPYKPDIFAPPSEKKTDAYGVQMFQWIYWDWCRRDANTYKSQVARYQINYNYAQGLINMKQFQDRINPTGDTSYLNLKYQAPAIMPKFIEQIVNKQSEQEYDVFCYAIDPVSSTERDNTKGKAYAKLLVENFLKSQIEPQIKQKITSDYYPEGDTPEEIELYFQTSCKLSKEISRELAIKYIFYLNEFKEIEKKCRWNALTYGIQGTYTAVVNDEIKVKVIEPRNLVIPNTVELGNLKGLPYYGELLTMTGSEIKRLTGWDDNKMRDIVAKYSKYSLNGNYTNSYGQLDINSYNDYQIEVMRAEFECYDSYEYRADIKENGRMYIANGKKAQNNVHKVEDLSYEGKCFYEGYWIVGTDFVFGYGRKKNMLVPKGNKQDAISGFSIYKHSETSLVERCISHIDHVILTDLKIQQFEIDMLPPGVKLDIEALRNVNVEGRGGKALNSMDLYDIFRQTGTFIYSSKDVQGVQSNYNPISEINLNSAQQLGALIQVYEFHKQQIRDTLGTNEYADGSTPKGDTLNGVMQQAIQQANTATEGINTGFLNIYKNTAEKTGMYVDYIAIFKGEFVGSLRALGLFKHDDIKYSSKDADADYGMMIDISPGIDQKTHFEENIKIAQANKEITLTDVMYIREVGRRDIKLAERLIALRSEKNQKAAQQMAAMNVQQNAQVQQQTLQAQAQIEQMQIEGKKELLTHEFTLKDELADKDAERTIKIDNNKSDNSIEEKHIDKTNPVQAQAS